MIPGLLTVAAGIIAFLWFYAGAAAALPLLALSPFFFAFGAWGMRRELDRATERRARRGP